MQIKTELMKVKKKNVQKRNDRSANCPDGKLQNFQEPDLVCRNGWIQSSSALLILSTLRALIGLDR